MDFGIPPEIRSGDVGAYLAYHLLGVRTPREMQSVMHYEARSSAYRALSRVRKYSFTIKTNGTAGKATVTATFVADLQQSTH